MPSVWTCREAFESLFTFKIYLINILFNIVLYTPKPPIWYCPLKGVLHALITAVKNVFWLAAYLLYCWQKPEIPNCEIQSRLLHSHVNIHPGHESWRSYEPNQSCNGTCIRQGHVTLQAAVLIACCGNVSLPPCLIVPPAITWTNQSLS
jgi:hypothetical protein